MFQIQNLEIPTYTLLLMSNILILITILDKLRNILKLSTKHRVMELVPIVCLTVSKIGLIWFAGGDIGLQIYFIRDPTFLFVPNSGRSTAIVL